ncbi:alpha/beta hydrolase family protein [Flavobacterium sp. FlaQc-47]|uniref:alpha/beta hydrolase family protein n=1 Tax=Flavobacterium sp. FlaQc-47 TaxID=3374180 RepID=UPI003757E260
MKTRLYISKSLRISIFLLLTICPVLGQIKKLKKVTQEDYQLWSKLTTINIANNAYWISYNLAYESSNDTLFVKNTISPKKFCFPKGVQGVFLNENHFGCLLRGNKFQVLNLDTGVIVKFDNISQFYAADGNIVLKENLGNGKIALHISDYNGNIKRSIENVTYYKLSPDTSKLAYVTSFPFNSLFILDFKKQNKETFISSDHSLSYPIIKWHPNGKSILFAGYSVEEKSYETLFLYDLLMKKLLECNNQKISNWPKDMALDARFDNTLVFSDDQQSIFFSLKKKDSSPLVQNKDSIEIWNAKDKDLFPERNSFGATKDQSRIAVWKPGKNTVRLIGDEIHSQALINPNQSWALVYDQDENKPYFKQAPDLTYWLFNTQTGIKIPFLEKQSAAIKSVYFSPMGKYFLYFKNQDWWLYSFKNQKHTNISQNSAGSFADYTEQMAETPNSFGCAGWTNNDQTVFLYDQFDIWEFNTQTGKSRRITFGKENQQIYRLVNPKLGIRGNFVSKEQIVLPGEDLILNVKKSNNTYTGFSYLDSERKIQRIVYDSALVHSIVKAKNSNTFLYVKEKFNAPPSLLVSNQKSTRTVLQTNPQHNQYSWGRSKLITYKNSKGNTLNAVLYYPANFDVAENYPMIVNIYEKQTNQLNVYTNPSNLNGCSINVSNYTNDGYFVLFPDIDFEIGNTGFSALDCVTSAVNAIVKNYPVNEKKIGLMGHSFGGYETDFIITQTKIFAAAIAGAAVTNFNSYYLSYNKANYKPEAWRFEYFQMRMGNNLFEDYDNYQNNSPVMHAANISTPLLAYTGKADTQVNPVQSNEFYLALRRLQKEHILLVYPNENHVFSKPENQYDLTKKRAAWFGHFLKDEPLAKWMESL